MHRWVFIILYVSALVHSVVRTCLRIFGKRYSIFNRDDDWRMLYLVIIIRHTYYFVGDIAVQRKQQSVLNKMLEELKYRVLWDDQHNMYDIQATVGVWNSCLFEDSHRIKLVILDEVPLEPFSKEIIREVYHDVLEKMPT